MSIVEKAADKLKTARPREQQAVQPEAFQGSPPPVTRPRPTEEAAPAVRPLPPAEQTFRPEHQTESVHIDFDVLRAAGMYPSEDNAGYIADQYRRIKRPLLANITGKGSTQVVNGRRIMVASSIPGEGKTFTSFNLALSIALERDHTALLIDGDVAKCDMTKILGMDDRPGLLDLLDNDRLRLDHVIAQTDVPRLKVLPAGQWANISTELLASRRMELLLDEITRSLPDCIVVFDSPPLLATSEAPVLAAAMGQIVVVVAAGRTPQNTVKAGVETLDADKSINMVLNLARGAGDGKRYGNYYYGGGYYNKGGSPHE
jgi:receptor protein-tyrosine kinase